MSGLDTDAPLELWLVDNAPAGSVLPEPGYSLLRLGRLHVAGGAAALEARLDPKDVAGFEIDVVVASAPGVHPGEGGLLFGMPSLFQKLHFAERRSEAAAEPALPAIFRGLVPRPTHAGNSQGQGVMAGLVEQGEDLFFNETFEGNGRTCGTCHPAGNNFTIDPAFIATLPDDDPLFVAEFVPALMCENPPPIEPSDADPVGPVVCQFENPRLMREFGLIVENVDGFGDSVEDLKTRFTMRGVPHTLGLPTSLDNDPDGGEGEPSQRTGWSADGAPGSGSLKEFAIGAVTQHFPKTLDRIAGLDFRLPTDHELDAMEAFQLTLGRQDDLDLATLALADFNADAGQALFLDPAVRCNVCHLNAGVNAVFDPNVNRNFDTGVEALVDEILDGTNPDPVLGRPSRPVDGGFGRDFDAAIGGFGNGEFNTTTLVEAADTPPFFHNNTVATLEEAVAFYTDPDSFGNSPGAAGAGPVRLDATEINQVAAFLRTINALENIRTALDAADRSRQIGNEDNSQPLILFALSEAVDAFEVLTGSPTVGAGGLGPQTEIAEMDLDDATFQLELARDSTSRQIRKFATEEAMDHLEAARATMLQPTI